MKTSFTIFKSLYDNTTDKYIDLESFERFEGLLYGLSQEQRASKKEAQLISPAVFQPDTTRKNINVVEWGGWAAIDVDDHVFECDLEQELKDRYGSYTYICYSTASSTESHPKFRLVFQCSERVEQDRIRHFWFALNTELGCIGDRQTKDLSRMYFIPGLYDGAYNFYFTNAGRPIEPSELIAKHPFVDSTKPSSFLDRLPLAMQQSILQHRKDSMNNTDIHWTSYRDCPFVSKKMLADYSSISDTGWYAKMYQLMCSIAIKAVENRYPITSHQIADLCLELDRDTGGWYQNRPFLVEAENAIEFAYRNAHVG